MNKIKYMITGIQYLENNSIKLHILINHFVICDEYKGYFPLTVIVDSLNCVKFTKHFKWIKLNVIHLGRYLLIYQKTNGSLVFKNNKYDNNLLLNNYNNYFNKLVYKYKLW